LVGRDRDDEAGKFILSLFSHEKRLNANMFHKISMFKNTTGRWPSKRYRHNENEKHRFRKAAGSMKFFRRKERRGQALCVLPIFYIRVLYQVFTML
jgi:hypothetical protein